jgi:cytochrome c oxidase assembly protein subunit 15
VRLRTVPGPRELAVPRWYASLAHATTAVLAVSIVFGVLTTASGPHSGDTDAGRSGFDSEFLEHVHAWPGYAVFAMTLVLLIAAWRLRLQTLGWAVAIVAVVLVQIAVGLYQARNGLPPVLVGIHMVLAALLAAAMTAFVMRLKRPAGTPGAAEPAELAASAR